ncbi:hypothetical protein DV737_g183, partial [Chaetothyriales sp. CBS 132003]
MTQIWIEVDSWVKINKPKSGPALQFGLSSAVLILARWELNKIHRGSILSHDSYEEADTEFPQTRIQQLLNLIIEHSQLILEQTADADASPTISKPAYDFLLAAYAAITVVEYSNSLPDVEATFGLMQKVCNQAKEMGSVEPVFKWATDMMSKRVVDVLQKMAAESYSVIELLHPTGPVYRRVSTAPPRLPTDDEIPLIDLSAIEGNFESRKGLAAKIRVAAEGTGFFYIYNHGISEELIQNALSAVQNFFNQPLEEKEKISFRSSESASTGYHGVGATQINRTETRDAKETFSMRYDPRNDPTLTETQVLQHNISDMLEFNDTVWKTTSHLEGFRHVMILFWQERLQLARKLIRIFALALDLQETYFDAVTTSPGADAVYVHYPGQLAVDANKEMDIGIGSHTDIQCFTLLWQDMSGGLQVLSSSGEWLDARPIKGTLVVNIGDFLERLSNNRFKSTVHRVYNRKPTSRFSMPFFFGFNPDSVYLHAGAVKQIVGGSLSTESPSTLQTNFVSTHSAAYYALCYRDADALGAHVIMLGPGNEDAAKEALAAWPGKLQVGGGITDANAKQWIDSGAERFLIHAADNEGLQQGIDIELVERLSEWCNIPVTYAGGARTKQDLDLVKNCSKGRVDLTIGSALDIFGGTGAKFEECIEWNKKQ